VHEGVTHRPEINRIGLEELFLKCPVSEKNMLCLVVATDGVGFVVLTDTDMTTEYICAGLGQLGF
jgi:hypothetical protein